MRDRAERREELEELIDSTREELLGEDYPRRKRRLERDIEDWQAQLDELSAQGGDTPPEPSPTNFVHPYPLQEHFTGRVAERRMLTEWFTSAGRPVLSLLGMGGQGKSALTWVWVRQDLLGQSLHSVAPHPDGDLDAAERPERLLWWSFYEQDAGFTASVDRALGYCSDGAVKPAELGSPHEKNEALVRLLEARRCLIVLDGFERELRAFSHMDAAYQGDGDNDSNDPDDNDPRVCTNIDAEDFLRRAAGLAGDSRVLITTRMHAAVLDGLDGCMHEDLPALSLDDAVAFMSAHGIRGARAEVRDACEPYGYHALALRLLAGVIVKDARNPGDVRVASRKSTLDKIRTRGRRHVLEVAYDALEEQHQRLLSSIAAFRHPMEYDAVAVFNEYASEKAFEDALADLAARGPVLVDPRERTYDLHPIVRHYAYERLANPEQVHDRLRDHFAVVPTPAQVTCLEDLTPTIELYHHTARAGHYGVAWELYTVRLHRALAWDLGLPGARLKLLRALCHGGDETQPRLVNERQRDLAIQRLASAHHGAGTVRRKVQLLQVIAARRRSLESVAVVAANRGSGHHLLGEFADAEDRLIAARRAAREGGARWMEFSACLRLGDLRLGMGQSQQAERDFAAAESALSQFVGFPTRGREKPRGESRLARARGGTPQGQPARRCPVGRNGGTCARRRA